MKLKMNKSKDDFNIVFNKNIKTTTYSKVIDKNLEQLIIMLKLNSYNITHNKKKIDIELPIIYELD